MSLFWIILVTFVSVLAGTGFCFWLLYQAREVNTTLWILEHIVCPIIRIVVLLLVVSQIYPAIDSNLSSLEFWRVLGRQGQFNHMINVVFIAGLLLAFIPVLNHPVFALPLQSMLTIALVFHWQYSTQIESLMLFPSLGALSKIFIYMMLAYFVTREVSAQAARWADERYNIEGSIRLIADAIYLSLQVPVMLIYCGFLKSQIP